MVSAQAAIKDYNMAVATYTECARKSGASDVEVGRVIGQLEKIAQQFNAELRAFKQKNGGQ
jgi:putative N-acetylmannosamine-6-phosphate epimerase